LDESFQMARVESVSIPVVGRVAAGEPILAEENIESYFSVPAEYLPKAANDIFALQVRGDSMVNAGIFDRDLLLVEQQNTARNGEIVVALIDDSATVKTYYKENGHYRLQPENDTMDPIIVDHVEILGKVRSLFRPSVVAFS
ncbi:MAG: repressor LexA, partial [Lachnospiraceae bacterium]|nr:repressor LexA [Lachnospiraceae bacterium]